MNISRYIKKNGLQLENVDALKVYQTVDIDFINSDGKEDETQFDVKEITTPAGQKELAELFKDFCIENNFSPNTVTAVTVTRTANLMEELGELSD